MQYQNYGQKRVLDKSIKWIKKHQHTNIQKQTNMTNKKNKKNKNH